MKTHRNMALFETDSDVEVSDSEDEEKTITKSDEDYKVGTSAKTTIKINKVTAPRRQAKPSRVKDTSKISNFIKKKKESKRASRETNKKIIITQASSKKNFSTKEMIINAVSNLNDKKGSSTVAIRKYVNDVYDVSQQRKLWITKLLKSAGKEGWLVQTSGTGASSGSHFKLPTILKKDKVKVNTKINKNKQK